MNDDEEAVTSMVHPEGPNPHRMSDYAETGSTNDFAKICCNEPHESLADCCGLPRLKALDVGLNTLILPMYLSMVLSNTDSAEDKGLLASVLCCPITTPLALTAASARLAYDACLFSTKKTVKCSENFCYQNENSHRA